MMTQNVKGTTMCWTNNGGDGLAFAPCTTATSQLWDGWNTDRVTVSNIGDWCAWLLQLALAVTTPVPVLQAWPLVLPACKLTALVLSARRATA